MNSYWYRWITLLFVVTLAACSSDPTSDNNKGNNGDNNGDINNGDTDLGTDMQGNNGNPDMGRDEGTDSGGDCTDECATDEFTCDGVAGYRVCGQYDTDSCLELSPPVACPGGYTCDEGRCVSDCRDTCTAGTGICADDDTVQVCGNFNSDACIEAGGDTDCPGGTRCEQGACINENDACTDECSANDMACYGDAVRACGDFDSDSCLDLGPPIACDTGEACSQGVCVPACSDSCPSQGATECVGDDVRTCEDTNNDGCLEWAVSACSGAETCSGGACSATCSDDCDANGTFLCSPNNTGVSLCGNFDSDSCLDLGSAINCPLGFGCSGGVCVASCTNECETGVTRCGQDGTSIETCANYDADPCLEWGGTASCPLNSTCTSGGCDTPCTDECTGTVNECVSGQNATRTCGQYDLDNCQDWSPASACESFETCSVGICELGATPATILVNEVLYDAIGGDGALNTTVFVELFGPNNQDLDGYSLVGINGSNGSEYVSIPLTGQTLGADGYFVITHPSADPILLAAADLTDNRIDLQNGPDSVQVVWRGRIVDALGYGVFGPNDIFGGEGTSPGSTIAGESLTRDAAHTDTDDNSADFTTLSVPTPGGTSLGCTDECTGVSSSQCSGVQVQICGDYDADNCLEWSTAAACPTQGDTCVGNACAAPCSNECSQQGLTQCQTGDVLTCGDYDADSCLEWSAPTACPSNNTCVVDQCQSAQAPEVVLISPQGVVQTTQGNVHRILVDPTATAGRTIAEVRYYANGAQVGSTTSTPHEYNYTIPTNHPTNTQIQVQARATDNVGEIGSSAYAYLDVKNDVPLATFEATITNTTTVTVDASAVSDTETATSALEVCWDWNNDGTCETAWSTMKIETHDYGVSGTYTVGMKVRDPQNQEATTTREVSFMDIQYIGGSNVTTTLWYGTIIITGDVTVPAGETLTIAAGTDVLLVNADQDNNGIGDYDITIDGTLIVNGTAAEPVTFTGYDLMAKNKGGWNRVILNGAGSTINYATIEYADVGLEIRASATVTNTTVRSTSSDCIYINGGSMSSLTDVNVTDCDGHGVHSANSASVAVTRLSTTNNGMDGLFANASSLSVDDSVAASNAANGFRVSNGTALDISDSTSELNTERGLLFLGDSSGTATQNQLRQNGAEGLGFVATSTGNPSPIINTNNIYSNATIGSAIPSKVTLTGITATYYTCCSSTGVYTPVYTAPAGNTIRRVYFDFDGGNYSSSDGARLLNADTGAVLHSTTVNSSGWVYLPPGVSAVRGQVWDNYTSSDNESVTLSQVDLVDLAGTADVVAITESGKIDTKFNYLGTFPNVLSRVDMSRSTALDLQGFTGVVYTSAWDRGAYVGGDSLTTTSWAGTIFVTGNVNIPAGETVTVAAGTQILFVDHDQDSDTEGDWSITSAGSFDLNGALGNEVVIRGQTPSGDDYQTITLAGNASNVSTWQDVTIANGKTAITISGNAVILRADITGGSVDGVSVRPGAVSSITSSIIDDAGRDAIRVEGAAGTFSKLTLRYAGEHGLHVFNNGTPTIEDSIIRENGGDGIHIVNAAPTANYNLITYNAAAGITTFGDSGPVFGYNIIKFNDDAGMRVFTSAGGNPVPVANYNNIYGNAVVGSTFSAATTISGITATYYTCCSSTGVYTPTYTAPAGQTIRRAYVSFDGGNYSSSDGARLLDATTGAVVRTYTSSTAGWVYLPVGVTAIRGQVWDNYTSSDNENVTISQVELFGVDTMTNHELVVSTNAGTTDARYNYWTPNIGDVPSKISETRVGSVDYSGFTGAEYPSGPVTEIGPRP